MASTPQKWLTCTPVRFSGDKTFFARDSGLLCKGFQEIGVECKAIMPGPPMEGDQAEDLIRTNYKNLENPDWWRQQHANGVVLYAWGRGRYRKIASAIRKAGLPLISNMDTSGVIGIVSGIPLFLGVTSRLSRQRFGNTWRAQLDRALKIAYGFLIFPIKVDIPRALHLRNSTIVSCVTPTAAERIRKACRWYGGENLAAKVEFIPHPIAPYMRYDPEVLKSDTIVAVGRWNDKVQKDPALLVKIIDKVCAADSSVTFKIVGNMPSTISHLFSLLNTKHKNRIHVCGVVPNAELRGILMTAQILLCSSSYESFHIASGEALCCGVSIVGPDLPEIPSMDYFATPPHGRNAHRSAEALAASTLEELSDWRNGLRDPILISKLWSARIHAPRVAAKILNLIEKIPVHQIGIQNDCDCL